VSIALSGLGSSFGGAGISAAIVGLVISLIIYALALFVMIQMRAGRNWARITIAVLGGIGLLFGVIGLIGQLAAFGFTAGIYGGAYPIVTSLFSLAQVVLVGAALYLMFQPASVKNYFT
jgi:hypothetical protein